MVAPREFSELADQSQFTSVSVAIERISEQHKLGKLAGGSGRGWSRLSTLQRCPRAFQLKYVKEAEERTSLARDVGSAFHGFLALFYLHMRDDEGMRPPELRHLLLEAGVNPQAIYEAWRLYEAYSGHYLDDYLFPIEVEYHAESRVLGYSCRYDLVAAVKGQVGLLDGIYIVEHKCLQGDARIRDYATGSYLPVAEYVARGMSPTVLALGKDGRLGHFAATVYPNVVRDIYRITTRAGRRIGVSDNHPFLTDRGWVPAAALHAGDWVATPRATAPQNGLNVSNEELRFIGYMLGDGTISSMTFTKTDAGVLDDFVRVAAALGEAPTVTRLQDKAPYVRLSIAEAAPAKRVLQKWGVSGLAADKRLPDAFKMLSADQARQLLGALWSTDGSVDVYKEHRKGRVWNKPRIAYVSRSTALAEDIRDLLLMVGIPATTTLSSVAYKGGRRSVATTKVVTRQGKRRFLAEVLEGRIPFLRSAEIVREALNVIPKEPHFRDGPDGAARDTEVGWDRVSTVVISGREMTYDVTVPGAENFVVEDLVTHNTASQFSTDVLEGWDLDGEILGQILLWKRQRLDKVFGPLRGTIVNITGKQKQPQFYRAIVSVDEALVREHERTIKHLAVVETTHRKSRTWPMYMGGCVSRYGRCDFWDVCLRRTTP